MAQLKDLLVTGDSRFLGHVYGTISQATSDATGNNIEQTYAKKNVATTTIDGLMSASDKEKLSTMVESAEPNQNAFSEFIIGNNSIIADKTTDAISFEALNGIIITPDVDNDKVIITAEVISDDLINQICN